MRITQLLHICFAVATLAGFTERISHLADSASNAMHMRLKSVDKAYKQLKNSTMEKINEALGRTKELVAKHEITKPRSVKEFKELFNKLANKAKENTQKEKTIEAAKEEEKAKKKKEEEKEKEEL